MSEYVYCCVFVCFVHLSRLFRIFACFSIAFPLFCWVFRGWILDIGGENVTKLPFCLSKHTSISLVFVCLVYLVLNARAQFRNRLYFCRFFFAFFSLASSDFSFLLFSLFSRKGLVTFWYHLRSCYLCQAHHLTKSLASIYKVLIWFRLDSFGQSSCRCIIWY